LRRADFRPMPSAMPFSVVTGANRGIGLALAGLLKQRGYDVLGACRSSSAELAKLGAEVVEGVDVSDEEGIARLATAVAERRVDLLVNNAGILVWEESREQLDVDGIRKQFEVNAVGPLRVTWTLRDRLGKGSKVALITSRMGSIDDNTSGGSYGYRMSKAALNMAGKSLAVDLKSAGVAVAILHPGMVKTDMIRGHGQVEPADAAKGLLARIDELTLGTSGGFWHANGERLPW
jgi:NAD(P)-dependent dehydrogenase (short-subunit alcohol dehydrogenase family)